MLRLKKKTHLYSTPFCPFSDKRSDDFQPLPQKYTMSSDLSAGPVCCDWLNRYCTPHLSGMCSGCIQACDQLAIKKEENLTTPQSSCSNQLNLPPPKKKKKKKKTLGSTRFIWVVPQRLENMEIHIYNDKKNHIPVYCKGWRRLYCLLIWARLRRRGY